MSDESPRSSPALEHSHAPEAIRARIGRSDEPSYVRDWVYGGIDGAVTTLAIAAGAIGASLAPRIVLILGLANLLADGFSMAAGNYSATKSEREDYERLRAIERRHIAVAPEGERAEIREIYAAKGFGATELERIVDVITADRERWVETMLREEYGLPGMLRAPAKAALSTFAAFVLCGATPLVAFLIAPPAAAFELAVTLTGVVFFAIGGVKARWSTAPWWRSGLETLAIGLAAAGVAFAVGAALEGFVS